MRMAWSGVPLWCSWIPSSSIIHCRRITWVDKYYPASHISTNEQKKDWLLRLNPNDTLVIQLRRRYDNYWLMRIKTERGRILIDNTQSPPRLPIMEIIRINTILTKTRQKKSEIPLQSTPPTYLPNSSSSSSSSSSQKKPSRLHTSQSTTNPASQREGNQAESTLIQWMAARASSGMELESSS